MISNFRYIDKTVRCDTVESLMNAHGGFTYAGSGTIADTDYDEIWTYTLINDGVLRQLEFWHPTSSTFAGPFVRWLVDGTTWVSLTVQSANIGIRGNYYNYRFVRVMDGENIVLDWFGFYASNTKTTFLVERMTPAYSESPQSAVYLSVGNSDYAWFGSRNVLGAPPSMNGTTPLVVARPYIFFPTSAGTTMWSRYLYDSTTLYAIQTPATNTIPSQNNYPFNIGVADWTEVVLNGHHFVALKLAGYDTSKEYISFFRIS